MKKFLLSLAIVAMASPAWAVTIAAWSTTPIVDGDKTYTLNSATGLSDQNVDVQVVDNGLVHSLNLSGLNNTANNFSLNFTVSINSGSNYIAKSRISQNDVLGNSTAGTSNTSTGNAGGPFTDNLSLTQVGTLNSYGTTNTQITFDTTSSGVDGSNFLSNITYDVLQALPPNPVPEPGTFVLAGLGIAGLVLARRRSAK
ncbi:MAG TPA: hypothetical protein DDY91_20580 [Planctomycetaceae bacterium]|nr:hypothetical protein [Planctomycetaceae bacterium]